MNNYKDDFNERNKIINKKLLRKIKKYRIGSEYEQNELI